MRPAQSGKGEGVLVGREGNIWNVRDADTVQRVVVDGNTVVVGDPQIGDQISVSWTREGDVLLAILIRVDRKASSVLEQFEFLGAIEKIEGEWWTVKGEDFSIAFKVTSNTEIDGDPALDRQAEVDAERRTNGEIWARKIVIRSLTEHDLQGMIELVSRDYLILRGIGVQTIYFNDRTQFAGDPPMVDRWAETRAMVMPDGRLVARLLMVHPPTPVPTPTPTETRRPTRTPAPTAPASATPTATSTSQPTATNTPRPTATNTPQPTATHTPPPTATNTPRPTATNTPQPTATHTPSPTVTTGKTAGGTR